MTLDSGSQYSPLLKIYSFICLGLSLIGLGIGLYGLIDPSWLKELLNGWNLSPLSLAIACLGFGIIAISCIAVMRVKDWGTNGVIAGCLIIFLEFILLGGPARMISLVLIVPVVLIFIRGWEERGGPATLHLKPIHKAGLQLESENPNQALAAYERLEERNKEVHPGLLLASAVCLPLSYLLALFVSERIPRYQGVVAVAIMCLVGLAPVMVMAARGSRRKYHPGDSGKIIEESWALDALAKMWLMGWVLILVLFADLIQLVFVCLLAALSAFVVCLPYNLALNIQSGSSWWTNNLTSPYTDIVFWVCFVPAFLLLVVDIRFLPFYIGRLVREISLGLNENADRVFSFVSNNLLSLLLANIVLSKYEVLYLDPYVGVWLYLFAGATLGWEFCRTEVDAYLGTINRIAKSRCLLLLRRLPEAEYSLYWRLKEIGHALPSHPTAIVHTGYAMLELLEKRPKQQYIEEQLDEAVGHLDEDRRYTELIKENILKIKQVQR
jgi:hypothetical protein